LNAEVNKALNGFFVVHTAFPVPARYPRADTPQVHYGYSSVTGFSPGSACAPPGSHPFPPGKAQRRFGSSHTTRAASTARSSREPRPRSAMYLPVNTHRTAVELTP
jgi:hypothetical protein